MFPGRLGRNFDSAVERIILVQQRQVRASATEKLREHFTKIDSHLSKRFAEYPSGGRVDLRNHIQQLAPRIFKIGVLCLEKLVSFFEFIVLLNGLEIYRAHVIELRAKIGDELLKIGVCKLDRVFRTLGQTRGGLTTTCDIARGALAPPFQLPSQNALERCLICYKPVKIGLVAARDVFREIVDLHLQLRFPHLSLSRSEERRGGEECRSRWSPCH